jgi:hypothetical protein
VDKQVSSLQTERRTDPPSLTRWQVALLAGILLLATLLRVGWPRLTEFKFSEARLEALALEVTREGRLPLIGVPSSGGFDHSPLSVYLYLPAFVGTTNPIPATVYGGLVGAAAVALCWWAGRRWPGGGMWAASCSALLLAANPWAVAFSRKIWQITFVPLLTLAFVSFLLTAWVGISGPPDQDRRRPWHLAWALALYAILLQIHPSAISLAPALLLWFAVFRRHIGLWPLFVGTGLGAITAVPFAVHQLQTGWPLLQAFRQLPESVWDPRAIGLAWEAITGRGIQVMAGDGQAAVSLVPQMARSFDLVGWLVVGSALVLVWRTARGWKAPDAARRRAARVDLVLVSWLVVPILFNLQHSLDLHLHFFALILPAAFLVIGRALATVWRDLAPSLAANGFRFGSATLVGLIASGQIVALVVVARFVATRTTQGGFGTPLGVYLSAADQAVEAAGSRQVLVIGNGDSPVVDETPAIFDVLLRDRADYRFVDGQAAALFPTQPSLAILTPNAGTASTWYAEWPKQAVVSNYPEVYELIQLDGGWPTTGLDQIRGPRLFQCGIELQAYRWRVGVSPGAGGQLWLLWQVLWNYPEETHFSARILDRMEREWGRQDGPGYPSAQRQKGDRILSKFDITQGVTTSSAPAWAWLSLYTIPEVTPVSVIDQAGNPVSDSVLMALEK